MNPFIALAITAVIIMAVIQNNINKRKKIQKLKMAYEQLLKGNNKKMALDAGRAYYSALRKNKVLTIYDEQAITNDLGAMIVEINNADFKIQYQS
jgi:type II secretory pathway pseudopilin PulG